MLTRDFVRLLENNGFRFKREGSDHTIYIRGNERESVPRHRSIKDDLAKAIIRRRGLK